MFHGWTFDPEGDQAAADSTRSSTSLDTGSLVNPRTARRLLTASYTSMIAHPSKVSWVFCSIFENSLERARTKLKLASGFPQPRRVVNRATKRANYSAGKT